MPHYRRKMSSNLWSGSCIYCLLKMYTLSETSFISAPPWSIKDWLLLPWYVLGRTCNAFENRTFFLIVKFCKIYLDPLETCCDLWSMVYNLKSNMTAVPYHANTAAFVHCALAKANKLPPCIFWQDECVDWFLIWGWILREFCIVYLFMIYLFYEGVLSFLNVCGWDFLVFSVVPTGVQIMKNGMMRIVTNMQVSYKHMLFTT